MHRDRVRRPGRPVAANFSFAPVTTLTDAVNAAAGTRVVSLRLF